jgi:hypothetical protein
VRWKDWRRSKEVEDFTDPAKPVKPEDVMARPVTTLAEASKLINSDLAKEAGSEDIKKPNASSGQQ